jgi:hypothetical protein
MAAPASVVMCCSGRVALQAHGGHRPGECPVGALAGVLFSLGKPDVELGRVGEQSVVAVAHRSDLRIDDPGQQRLEFAVPDAAAAIALSTAAAVRGSANARSSATSVDVSGSFGCSGGVESVTIHRIWLLMTHGSAMRVMVLP